MSFDPSASLEKAQQLLQEAYNEQTQGSVDQAIKLYQESLDSYPTAEAHTFLGWAYSQKTWFDQAIEECKKAIELDPDFGNPYNDIGAYLIEKNELDEAEEWLEKALEAKRYDAFFYAHFNLGRLWEKKENWFRALSHYQEAYRLNPDYGLAEKALVRLQSKLN